MSRQFIRWLLVISAVALLLRLVAGWELSETPFVATPPIETDMATYQRLGQMFHTGQWPKVFDYQPFYYAVFLPLVWLFTPSAPVMPVIAAQALVGAATIWLTGLSAARLFGRKAGLLAAAILALSKFHIFYSCFFLLEVWFAFWAAAVLYCLIRTLDRNSRWFWPTLLGAAAGFALLTRGSALLWLPGIAALVVWRHWRSPKKLALHCGLMAMAFVLPLLPFSIYNSMATGRFCGPSVAGSKVLVLGNSPEAPAGGLEYPRTYHQWVAEDNSGQRSATANILQWALKEPGVFAELTLRKVLLFWDKDEIPNNVAFYPHGNPSKLLQLPMLLPWAVIASLGLAGLLVAAWSRRRHRLALVWLLLAVWGGISLFYLLARFRIVALPLMAIFAAAFLHHSWRRFRRFQQYRNQFHKRRLLQALLALLVGIFTVCAAYSVYQQLWEDALFRKLRPHGTAMTFPTEAVIYDHGPLSTGIKQVIGVPPEGLTLTKRFVLPTHFRSMLPNGTIHQQLMLRMVTTPKPFRGDYPAAMHFKLTANGNSTHATGTIRRTMGIQWLILDFYTTLPNNTIAEFTLNLAPTPAEPQFGFVADLSRNYHRSTLRFSNSPTTPLAAEATMEWIIPLTPPENK